MSADRIGFEQDPSFRNETGFNFDADFYSLLNVPPDASLKQINKAYKSLSLTYHPDKMRQGRLSSNLPTI
jgi:preprotein translocase subunit Sec63